MSGTAPAPGHGADGTDTDAGGGVAPDSPLPASPPVAPPPAAPHVSTIPIPVFAEAAAGDGSVVGSAGDQPQDDGYDDASASRRESESDGPPAKRARTATADLNRAEEAATAQQPPHPTLQLPHILPEPEEEEEETPAATDGPDAGALGFVVGVRVRKVNNSDAGVLGTVTQVHGDKIKVRRDDDGTEFKWQICINFQLVVGSAALHPDHHIPIPAPAAAGGDAAASGAASAAHGEAADRTRGRSSGRRSGAADGTLPVGTRVQKVRGNGAWTFGEVIEVRAADGKVKVMRDDGSTWNWQRCSSYVRVPTAEEKAAAEIEAAARAASAAVMSAASETAAAAAAPAAAAAAAAAPAATSSKRRRTSTSSANAPGTSSSSRALRRAAALGSSGKPRIFRNAKGQVLRLGMHRVQIGMHVLKVMGTHKGERGVIIDVQADRAKIKVERTNGQGAWGWQGLVNFEVVEERDPTTGDRRPVVDPPPEGIPDATGNGDAADNDGPTPADEIVVEEDEEEVVEEDDDEEEDEEEDDVRSADEASGGHLQTAPPASTASAVAQAVASLSAHGADYHQTPVAQGPNVGAGTQPSNSELYAAQQYHQYAAAAAAAAAASQAQQQYFHDLQQQQQQQQQQMAAQYAMMAHSAPHGMVAYGGDMQGAMQGAMHMAYGQPYYQMVYTSTESGMPGGGGDQGVVPASAANYPYQFHQQQ